MGQEKEKDIIVQISDKKKREYLLAIISKHLEMNIALMNYYKSVAPDRKSKLVCTKSIKETEQALVHIHTIKHIDLLEYLYSRFIGSNAIMFATSCKVVNAPTLKEWDTQKGHQDFINLMNENRKKLLEKEEEQRKANELIEKAKSEGKRVERVWDNETKSTKLVIVEDNPKA